MLKKIIWPLILFISIALTIVFISGFITSVNVSKSEEKDSVEKPITNAKKTSEEGEASIESSEILILGDSVGFGLGDEENLGLEKRYLDIINKKGENKKEVTNISVPGYESTDLVNLIKSGENDSVISNASLIIISIGGNDINRLESEDNVILTVAFEKALKNYQTNLKGIIKEIRKNNPDAQLAFIGLYDPYNKEEPEKTKLLLEWNYETRLIVNSDFKFTYIPTYELFEYHLDEYLSPDGFHPSGLGYQMIAEELDRVLN